MTFKKNYWKKRNEARKETKLQAASIKPEDLHATNTESFKQQAASDKHQAPSDESHKPQASSDKQQAS